MVGGIQALANLNFVLILYDFYCLGMHWIWVVLSDLMYSILTRMTLMRNQGVNVADDSSGLK